jgi:hypothetical protein
MVKRHRAGDRQAYLLIKDQADIDRYLGLLRSSAAHLKRWIVQHNGDALDLLRSMKFEVVGRHPIEDRPLNFVEQVNQTWTYAAALAATRKLLELHPEANGFKVAPGADMALPLDIMSVVENLVGAEVFAAVDPRNNRKLALDLAKLANRPELHRYVFFSSPGFPGLQHRHELDTSGVQVWSADILL